MNSSAKTYNLNCIQCAHTWEITAYPRQTVTDVDSLLKFRQEQNARVCPKCGDRSLARDFYAPPAMPIPQNADPIAKLAYDAIPARYTLNGDVVLPPITKLHIEEALVKIKYHHKIYHEWGYKAVDRTGAGVILNFYGKPGTGKTHTAEALAGSLGRSFISLGMSDVESKYMGDTANSAPL